MNAQSIRDTFLKFFESKGHQIVPSSPVIPQNDPSILFTNAGMNQFKNVFLGLEQRPYTKAASVQKCIRAGGKHNDLENVGYTARHHTFFEMLGNFSFGDYFKQEAIGYAWELLVTVFKIPQDKLWVTVYSEDEETYAIWKDHIGVPVDRIVKIGDNKGGRFQSDNFWTMGDTGPCGPCTEIFYDHGPQVAGGPPGSAEQDGDRFVEIWNLVFMQYNRTSDGQMLPLPKPCVDTGMGLERIAAVLQHVTSNYETNEFKQIITFTTNLMLEMKGSVEQEHLASLHVIADHARACAVMIADNVLPSNTGAGYVLRRLIRRAVRHAYKLGVGSTCFCFVVGKVCLDLGETYPELKQQVRTITSVVDTEETYFFRTIKVGMKLLDKALSSGDKQLSGKVAFQLHDTHGFPLDLTSDICRERGVTVDCEAFNALMLRQKEMSRAKHIANQGGR